MPGPPRELCPANALEADCQAHWWVSSHRTAPSQEVGQKKWQEDPGRLGPKHPQRSRLATGAPKPADLCLVSGLVSAQHGFLNLC